MPACKCRCELGRIARDRQQLVWRAGSGQPSHTEESTRWERGSDREDKAQGVIPQGARRLLREGSGHEVCHEQRRLIAPWT